LSRFCTTVSLPAERPFKKSSTFDQAVTHFENVKSYYKTLALPYLPGTVVPYSLRGYDLNLGGKNGIVQLWGEKIIPSFLDATVYHVRESSTAAQNMKGSIHLPVVTMLALYKSCLVVNVQSVALMHVIDDMLVLPEDSTTYMNKMTDYINNQGLEKYKLPDTNNLKRLYCLAKSKEYKMDLARIFIYMKPKEIMISFFEFMIENKVELREVQAVNGHGFLQVSVKMIEQDGDLDEDVVEGKVTSVITRFREQVDVLTRSTCQGAYSWIKYAKDPSIMMKPFYAYGQIQDPSLVKKLPSIQVVDIDEGHIQRVGLVTLLAKAPVMGSKKRAQFVV